MCWMVIMLLGFGGIPLSWSEFTMSVISPLVWSGFQRYSTDPCSNERWINKAKRNDISWVPNRYPRHQVTMLRKSLYESLDLPSQFICDNWCTTIFIIIYFRWIWNSCKISLLITNIAGVFLITCINYLTQCHAQLSVFDDVIFQYEFLITMAGE